MTGATNAELARRAFGAANRQPKPDYEVVNALYHPDHEFVAQLTDVEGTTFRGAQGFREWLTNMRDAWQSWDGRSSACRKSTTIASCLWAR